MLHIECIRYLCYIYVYIMQYTLPYICVCDVECGMCGHRLARIIYTTICTRIMHTHTRSTRTEREKDRCNVVHGVLSPFMVRVENVQFVLCLRHVYATPKTIPCHMPCRHTHTHTLTHQYEHTNCTVDNSSEC